MQEIGANSLHTPYIYNRIQRPTHTNGGRAKNNFRQALYKAARLFLVMQGGHYINVPNSSLHDAPRWAVSLY